MKWPIILLFTILPSFISAQYIEYDHLIRQLKLFSPTDPVPSIHFRNTSTTADWILKHDGIKFHIQDESVEGHEKLTIQSNGNIGIGTTDPLDRLDVRGGVRIRGNIDISHSEDETSMFIGRNAGVNTDFTLNGYNTFVGVGAGFNHTSGRYNSFFGRYSGRSNMDGSYNSFFGRRSGYFNMDGSFNSFFGESAGHRNRGGHDNSFFGFNAGYSCIDGYNNSFFGAWAGYDNDGHSNSIFGNNAGVLLTEGGQNSFFGASSGNSQKKGTRNTFIGTSADSKITKDSLDRAIAIGYKSKVACHSCATIGGTGIDAVNAGINIDSPEVRLHIRGAENDGSSGTLIIENQDGDLRKMLFDGNEIDVLEDFNLFLQGNSAGDVRLVEGGGSVGLGLNPSASYQLHLSSGDAAKPGGGSWISSSSDRRLKTNIRSYDDGLDKVLKIRPVWYQYIDRFDLPTDNDFIGVIAQEIQEVTPYMVGITKYKERDGSEVEYLNFDQNALTFMLINAVQEMKNTIDLQQNELMQLRNELMEMGILKQKIENIESFLYQKSKNKIMEK